MVETLKRMRGFRNILVHEYIQVDDRIVYDAASGGLREFEAFVGGVLDYIRHHRRRRGDEEGEL